MTCRLQHFRISVVPATPPAMVRRVRVGNCGKTRPESRRILARVPIPQACQSRMDHEVPSLFVQLQAALWRERCSGTPSLDPHQTPEQEMSSLRLEPGGGSAPQRVPPEGGACDPCTRQRASRARFPLLRSRISSRSNCAKAPITLRSRFAIGESSPVKDRLSLRNCTCTPRSVRPRTSFRKSSSFGLAGPLSGRSPCRLGARKLTLP